MPLPPYIQRDKTGDSRDRSDYQTVFARRAGAVAAPTAGLHFTDRLLQRLAERGIDRVNVTLHVGAGTFLPVKTEEVEAHARHGETGEVSAEARSEERGEGKEGAGRVRPRGPASHNKKKPTESTNTRTKKEKTESEQ